MFVIGNFKHNIVNLPKEDISRIEKDGYRVYSTPEGIFPSVTSVVGWEKNKYFAKWRNDNKQLITEKRQQFRNNNKEKLAEQGRQFRNNNKEKLAIYNKNRSTLMTCECGSNHTLSGKSQHLKTLKHLAFVPIKI